MCLHTAPRWCRPSLPRHQSRTRRCGTSSPKLMCWPRWPYAHAGLRLARRSVLSRCVCNAQEHEQPEELCSINILEDERERSGDRDGLPGVRIRHRTPTCRAQVRISPFASRAVAVDDSCEQTSIACPSSFVGHCVPWRSPYEGRKTRAPDWPAAWKSLACCLARCLALRSSGRACGSSCLLRCCRARIAATTSWPRDTCVAESTARQQRPSVSSRHAAHRAAIATPAPPS